MVDILISYSEPRAQDTLPLAIDVETKGYKACWQTGPLSDEDVLPQALVDEISAAKVVVMIWTPQSVLAAQSCALVREAMAQGKLLQLRHPALDKRLIPLPFRLGIIPNLNDFQRVFESFTKRGLQAKAPVKRDAASFDPEQQVDPTVVRKSLEKVRVCVGAEAKENWFTPGANFRDFEGAPEMVVIAAGEFLMGSKEGVGHEEREYPQHLVTIPEAFAVGKYPVTFSEWEVFAKESAAAGQPLSAAGYEPDDKRWGRGARPVINVSWNDARDYIAWLNSKVKSVSYRLLSEAEWEYVCLAGSTLAFCYGSDERELDDYGWSNRNARGKTHPVGEKKPNDFGLYDMHGNVWEWCQDDWHESYHDKPDSLKATGGAWETDDQNVRVLRGGAWLNVPTRARASYRFSVFAENRYPIVGFRVARALVPSASSEG